MIVEVENNLAQIVSSEPHERSWLEDYLSFERRAFVQGRGARTERETFVSLLGSFPAGFLTLVVAEARDENIRFEVHDKRSRPCKFNKKIDLRWLRDYQLEAVKLAEVHPRGVFHHATSAGKTEIFIALTLVYECSWLILTHRKTLLHQIRKRIKKRTGEDVGQIGDGKHYVKRVTVGTFDSVRAAMRVKANKKYFDSVQAVAVDECHISAAKRNKFVLLHLPNAYYRYGFSGTPFARGDRKNPLVVGTLGPTIHRVKAIELVRKGVAAEAKIVLIPVRHPSVEGKWYQAYALCIGYDRARLRTVRAIVRKATKPALLFVKEIEHGKRIRRLLEKSGIACEFVWGKHKTPERDAAIQRLVDGDSDVLICNVIFQEGVDIPELRDVINAGGGKSIIAQLQQLGRGMRRHDSRGNEVKSSFRVFDILDLGCGCKTDPKSGKKKHKSCSWFDDHSRKRKQTYMAEGYSVVIDASLAR